MTFGFILGGICFYSLPFNLTMVVDFCYQGDTNFSEGDEMLPLLLPVSVLQMPVAVMWLFETRMNENFVAVQPLVIFDCLFIVLFGPIGNVNMLMLRCPEAYVAITLRVGFYLSVLSLPCSGL